MKTLRMIAPYLAALLLACGTFIGGWYAGMQNTVTVAAGIFNPGNMQNLEMRAMEDHALLLYLDRSEGNKAAGYLRTREDGNIMAINSISQYADLKTRLWACKLMKGIAQRREKYSEKSEGPADIQAEVDSILKALPMCDK